MIENFWIMTPDMFWVIVISTTFWLTCKGLVMDMFGRSVTRTAITSAICLLAIAAMPGATASGYNGDTEWMIYCLAAADVVFSIAIAPGEFAMMIYEVLNQNV